MMKTDFKLSSKMHLFIIISSIIIAIGAAVGTICQFVANGYFNYGADWESYKSVTVSYVSADFADKNEVKEICEKAFADAGVRYYYSVSFGEKSGNTVGGEYTFKFNYSVKEEKLQTAVNAINAVIADKSKPNENEDNNVESVIMSTASAHTVDGLNGNGKALWRGAVAIASVIALHFIYFAVRFKLTMALGALLADVHNLAVFVSLLSLTRVPVGSSIITFAALTVLLTAIGTCFLFDRVRKNAKDEANAKLGAFELTDKSAGESFKINLFMPVCIAAVAVVVFVLASISAMSVIAVLAPAFGAIICCVSCGYGLLLFTPAVYSRFKQIGDNYKQNHTRAPKEKVSK